MKKTAIDFIEVTPEPYSKFGARPTQGSKYDPIFTKAGENMRIKVPIGDSQSVSNALRKHLERRGRNAMVKSLNDCGDGFGGVWWFTKPAQTVSNFKPQKGKK